ncbi:MAG: 5'/3'-nucleotidase SurE [Muribaculaceae bacterium]|nr:5'/3'-nucleotidase SurE [Muribaculaceae bacterium]
MIVLISNDDGIGANGLRFLIDRMRSVVPDAEIYAVAPDGPRSGQSSAITVNQPLSIITHPDYNGAKMFSVTGTPVDCVKLAMHAIVPRTPDLMLSGVNHGSNAGNSNIYSGTMGAAMEACMIGIPAIGFSLLDFRPDADFGPTAPSMERIIRSVIKCGLPEDVCLNVNMPAGCEPQGIKVTTSGRGRWTEEYADYVDPFGRKFYWLTGRYIDMALDDSAADSYWLSRGYVTVTPIRPDQTAGETIAGLSPIFD